MQAQIGKVIHSKTKSSGNGLSSTHHLGCSNSNKKQYKLAKAANLRVNAAMLVNQILAAQK